MNKNGPIIIIDDDIEDHDILGEVFKDLNYPNEIVFFNDGQLAYDYLVEKAGDTFLIFSDMNMPKMTGVELQKRLIDSAVLGNSFVPFLFFTTSAAPVHISDAYSNSTQGFFIKPSSFKAIKETVKLAVDYWQTSLSPN